MLLDVREDNGADGPADPPARYLPKIGNIEIAQDEQLKRPRARLPEPALSIFRAGMATIEQSDNSGTLSGYCPCDARTHAILADPQWIGDT